MFAAVRDLPTVDRRHLLAACERRLTGMCSAEHNAGQAAAIEALNAYRTAHEGRWPSKGQFDTWRRESGAPAGLPSSFKVGSAFGSWDAAKAAARGGKPVQILHARRLRAMGSPYTRDEMLDAIRACGRALRQRSVTWLEYREWARAELRRDPSVRFPLSVWTFDQRGGWLILCGEAGLLSESAKRMPPRHYDIDELRAAASQAWAYAGGSYLKRCEYTHWRKVARAADAGASLPDSAAFTTRWGGWPEAMHGLGLIDDAQLAAQVRRSNRPRGISDEEAFRAISVARRDVPGNLSAFAYTRWRCELALEPGDPVPPSAPWFRKRFGSWTAALEAADAFARGSEGS